MTTDKKPEFLKQWTCKVSRNGWADRKVGDYVTFEHRDKAIAEIVAGNVVAIGWTGASAVEPAEKSRASLTGQWWKLVIVGTVMIASATLILDALISEHNRDFERPPSGDLLKFPSTGPRVSTVPFDKEKVWDYLQETESISDTAAHFGVSETDVRTVIRFRSRQDQDARASARAVYEYLESFYDGYEPVDLNLRYENQVITSAASHFGITDSEVRRLYREEARRRLRGG